ncbi:hypothetical protein [Lysobacter panacisoli]|uniref:Tetratricopeptide repeat protein n=1 Tax=Lysobacter panacisoli TaxID=1255263 RepID=A0ABP9LGQ4_9GAMM|nr:hypothetical protein [Lysobacter panacisoli]
MKRWPDAIEAIETVLAKSPDHTQALLQLSYLNSIGGHYRMAHRHTVQCPPKWTRYERWLGPLREHLKD